MARKSSISRLPAEIKSYIEAMLATGAQTLDELIADLQERFPAEARAGQLPSRSAVHRYGQKLDRRLAAIKASTEAARLIAQSAPDEADEHSAAVLRMVQSSLFEAMTRVTEAQDANPAEQVKILSQAARAIAEASRASIGQKKWADEVKQKLDALEAVSGKGDKRLDADTLKAVREALYGG